jgi:tripartite-type tricarboxylate transporter receptor subunit TctC
MLWRWTIALLLALALQPDGVAQAFPARPIVIVVPYAAGGAPDFVARILAEKLTASLGQPVRVDNRPGASGNIAAANVAQSAPDGHTLLIGDNALLTISPFVYRNDSFNAVRDLVPVAALVESSVLLLVSADLPVTTLQEFVDYARRARPPLAYGTTGVGSGFQLTFEQLKRQAGIDLLHVPYRSLTQAAAAAATGEIAVLLGGASAVPFLQSGKLRALAVASPVRSRAHPGLPALNEYFPGVELSLWQGLFAPVGTPEAVLEQLEDEVDRILAMPDALQRLANANDLRPLSITRLQLEERIRQEGKRNSATIKQLGLRVE